MCHVFIPMVILHHSEHDMQQARNTDYLIIGQGLAGTLLSYQLHQAGIDHLVVDQRREGAASHAAAGLINPIVIKRMVKTWQADRFFPDAFKQYSELEIFLKTRFFHPKPILKIFGEEDRTFWHHQIDKENLSAYASVFDSLDAIDSTIQAPFGVGRIVQAARLDMTGMLNAYRLFLKQSGALVEEIFHDDDLVIEPEAIQWQAIRAKKIIFCRGAWDEKSPFFQALKFRNTKGELLDVEIPQLNSDNIISKGVFVMPIGKEKFKIGATYAHHWQDLSVTEEKKEELLRKWGAISEAPLIVKKQITGIRPTLHDRRPVLGFLKDCPQVGIFNGLGSRGGIMAPYLAREMVKGIQEESYKSFNEIRLERFY